MNNVFLRCFAWSVAALWVAGCEQSLKGEGGASGAGGGVGGGGLVDDNGQTGSPGGIGGGVSGAPGERTCEEHDCVAEITANLSSDFNERPDLSFAIIDARCEEDHSYSNGIVTVRGPLCTCELADEDRHIGAEPLGCAVRGHTHECVMEHGEFEACDPSDPEACESVCAELQARLEADALTSKPYRVRSARCDEEEFLPGRVTTICSDAVIEIDGFCYATEPFLDWNNWQSCELSDEEVQSAPAPELPHCDDIPESVPTTADCRPACDDASACEM